MLSGIRLYVDALPRSCACALVMFPLTAQMENAAAEDFLGEQIFA